MRLDKKYRPADLAGVIAQPKAVALIKRFLEPEYKGLPGICGRAFYITGKSGTGKTTLALIMSNMIADPLYITEIVGRQVTPTFLADQKHRWAYMPMASKQGHVLIVNESHGLMKPAIEVFLDLLENIPDNVLIVFTTTRYESDKNKQSKPISFFETQADAKPFISRCVNIKLAERDLTEPFAARLKEIATIENLDGQPIEAYVKLCKENRNNFRACLMDIDAGKMLN